MPGKKKVLYRDPNKILNIYRSIFHKDLRTPLSEAQKAQATYIINKMLPILGIETRYAQEHALSESDAKKARKAFQTLFHFFSKTELDELHAAAQVEETKKSTVRASRTFSILHQIGSNLGLTLEDILLRKKDTSALLQPEYRKSFYAAGGLPNFIGETPKQKLEAMEDDDYIRRPINILFYLSKLVTDMVAKATPISSGESKESESTPPPISKIIAKALARTNINITSHEPKTDADIASFQDAVKNILAEDYNRSTTPEEITDTTRATARNLLRYLIRGTVGKSGKEGRGYVDALATIEHCVDGKKDPILLTTLRQELGIFFNNAADWIIAEQEKVQKDPSKQAAFEANEKIFNILMHDVAALYPFIDPIPGKEHIMLPQKVGDQWVKVTYDLTKLDISPQEGSLAEKINALDESKSASERISAYGLKPIKPHQDTKRHLLLMGTTFPTGTGAALAGIYNFRPFYSVGEGHDLRHVDEWIRKGEQQVIVSGKSKGATMAMIIAENHPEKIHTAHCINPAALNAQTLKRLHKKRQERELKYDGPEVNVYAQAGDPVFALENGFMPGTHIFRIFPSNPGHETELSNFKPLLPATIQRATDAHIQSYCGRSAVTIVRGNIEKYNHSRSREFRGDMKEAANMGLFCILWMNYYANLHMQKEPSSKYYMVPAKAIIGIISIALFLTSMLCALLVSGVKVGVRSALGIRSDYQKTTATGTPPSPPQKGVSGSSAERAMLDRDISLSSSSSCSAAMPPSTTKPEPEHEREWKPEPSRHESIALTI